MTYTFVQEIDATDITLETVSQFRSKRIGVLIIHGAD